MADKPLSSTELALEHAVEGRVIYLLALIVLVQFAYPVTAYGFWALALYQVLYASLIVVGVIVGRDSRRHMLLLGVTGLIYLTAGLVYAFNPTEVWIVALTYLALIPYQTLLVSILARFLIVARSITRDVLYAATAIYLLLGAVFVPLYGLLEMAVPGSLRDSAAVNGTVQWQQLVYFSYTTLTSSGYGDILPISWWARSLANLEMIAGMLYITIVMARLVSLYQAGREG